MTIPSIPYGEIVLEGINRTFDHNPTWLNRLYLVSNENPIVLFYPFLEKRRERMRRRRYRTWDRELIDQRARTYWVRRRRTRPRRRSLTSTRWRRGVCPDWNWSARNRVSNSSNSNNSSSRSNSRRGQRGERKGSRWRRRLFIIRYVIIREMMRMGRRRKDKSHERKPSSSSSSGKSTSSIAVSVPSGERQPSVKLRESAAQRRERRKGGSRDEPPHSSSGNWSASSESGRASIGSETTTTTHQPRYDEARPRKSSDLVLIVAVRV